MLGQLRLLNMARTMKSVCRLVTLVSKEIFSHSTLLIYYQYYYSELNIPYKFLPVSINMPCIVRNCLNLVCVFDFHCYQLGCPHKAVV